MFHKLISALIRLPPIDPPEYALFYAAILVIIFGTGAYIALRKMKEKDDYSAASLVDLNVLHAIYCVDISGTSRFSSLSSVWQIL